MEGGGRREERGVKYVHRQVGGKGGKEEGERKMRGIKEER